MKYLLIDDNMIDLLVNEKIILNTEPNAAVVKQSSGAKALEWLRSLEPAALPDIILLDIKMPLMDGFQFLDEFEKLPESVKNHPIRIYMLSSSIDPADIEKSANSFRVEGFIEKPLSKEGLKNINHI